jgi:hypothetical protein
MSTNPDATALPVVRLRRSKVVLVAFGALALVSMLVMRTSQAAFVATTANEGNSFSAGGVELTDDGASAMFTATAMAPGQTVTRCITVTYAGSIPDPGPVRLYGGGFVQEPGPSTGSQGIAGYLNLPVEEGGGGSYATCAGFTPSATIVSGTTLAGFNAARTGYATGAGQWDPSSTPSSRTYRFSLQLDPATPGSEQEAGVSGAVFAWEVQS